MENKFFEIRDRATFIPTLAISISGSDGYLARRAGFGSSFLVMLIRLNTLDIKYSPHDWRHGGSRTMQVAHKYIADHWYELKSNDVIDVEFILGETEEKKESEEKDYPQNNKNPLK